MKQAARLQSFLAKIFCLCAITTLVAGCSSAPKSASNKNVDGKVLDVAPLSDQVKKPQDPEPRRPANSEEPVFNAPEALARKTAEYSREMQAISDPKTAPTTAPTNLNSQSVPENPQSKINKQAIHPADGRTASSRLPEASQRPDPRSVTPHNSIEKDLPEDMSSEKDSAPMEEIAGARIPAPDQAHGGSPDNAGANTAASVSANSSSPTESLSPSLPPPTPIGSSSELAPKLDHRVKENPRDVSAHLDYQLLRFLLDDRVPDLSSLSSLPAEDRELVSSVIDGLINFRSGLRQDNNMLLSRKVRPLMEMADRLRGQADLMIPSVALCTAVRTFGEYDPIDPPRFAAGKGQEVILYCEVENFSSIVDAQQLWQTKLTQETVLYTENGMAVWSDKTKEIEDLSRRRRHDFFVVKKMRIPANLAVGRYFLKVTIVDQQINRVAEATLPIVIAVQ